VAAYAAAVFLICAVAFSTIRAFQDEDGVDYGWLAIAAVIAALWLMPVLQAVAKLATTNP
jgi:hypothetical protein